MSYGMAPRFFASDATSFAGTKMNSGWGSMKRAISHGHAMRSTRARSRVIHFMVVVLLESRHVDERQPSRSCSLLTPCRRSWNSAVAPILRKPVTISRIELRRDGGGSAGTQGGDAAGVHHGQRLAVPRVEQHHRALDRRPPEHVRVLREVRVGSWRRSNGAPR